MSRNSTRSCHKLLIAKGSVPKLDRPPDPETKRPGASGKAARAKKKRASVVSQQPRITTRRSLRQEPDRDFALYDGRVRLATISCRTGQFMVMLPAGVVFGVFDSLTQARKAISAVHGGGQ